MSKMFNYEADQIHEMVHPDLLTDTTHYVAECKDIILNEVTPNYPKLTEYEKEWFYFANHIYQDGQPVNLEYQTMDVDGYASVENAIPFNYKHAILKGNTFVNLLERLLRGCSYDSETGIYTSTQNEWVEPVRTNQNVKVNVPYTLFAKVNSTSDYIYIRLDYNDGTSAKDSIINGKVTPNSDIFIKTTIMFSKEDKIRFVLRNAHDGVVKMSNIMLIEGDHTNQDIPYFDGMQSVKIPVLTTTGKNLFDVDSLVTDLNLMSIERVKDGVRLKANESQVYRCAYSRSFKVESGKYYNITYTVENENPNNVANITLKNINGDYFSGFGDCTITGSGTATRTFLAEKSGYVRPQLYASMGKDNGDYYVTYTNVMISKVSTSNDVNVEHEPYQSNILTVNEEVTLRGIGDVRDTLNCLTEQVTQRIVETVLNGSEDWQHREPQKGENTLLFQLSIGNKLTNDKVNAISNKMMGISANTQWSDDNESVSCNVNGSLGLRINKIKLATQDINGLKQYLSQNPITVQYILETESIKTVDLNGKPKPYEGTNHIVVSSDTIPPSCTLSIPVESTGAKTLNDISQED